MKTGTRDWCLIGKCSTANRRSDSSREQCSVKQTIDIMSAVKAVGVLTGIAFEILVLDAMMGAVVCPLCAFRLGMNDSTTLQLSFGSQPAH